MMMCMYVFITQVNAEYSLMFNWFLFTSFLVVVISATCVCYFFSILMYLFWVSLPHHECMRLMTSDGLVQLCLYIKHLNLLYCFHFSSIFASQVALRKSATSESIMLCCSNTIDNGCISGLRLNRLRQYTAICCSRLCRKSAVHISYLLGYLQCSHSPPSLTL